MDNPVANDTTLSSSEGVEDEEPQGAAPARAARTEELDLALLSLAVPAFPAVVPGLVPIRPSSNVGPSKGASARASGLGFEEDPALAAEVSEA